jgi:hypothetical protein
MCENPRSHTVIPAQPGWVRLIPWPTEDGLILLRLPIIAWEVIPGHAAIPITAWGLPGNKESSFITAPNRSEVFDGDSRWWPDEAAFLDEKRPLGTAEVRNMAKQGYTPSYSLSGGPLGPREFYPRDGGAP